MVTMLLDDFVPFYDVGESHDILVQAPPEKVFSTFRTVNLAGSRTAKVLMGIRDLPGRLFSQSNKTGAQVTIEDMMQEDFILLAEKEPWEIVMGAVGCFWKPVPSFIRVEPESFASFSEPGFNKMGWNLKVDAGDDNSVRVSTQTRVRCLGPKALAGFLPYWMVIRAFTGLIRIKMLQEIKRLSEKQA